MLNTRRFVKHALVGVSLLASVAGSVAHATVINSTVPAQRIDYHFFSFAGGPLSIAVNGIGLSDPMIHLLTDDGSAIGALTGALIATDDDGGPGVNSLLDVNLLLGNYVLAVGAFFNDITESRIGIASTPSADGSYEAIYTPDISLVAVRNSRDDIGFSTAVPEPVTLALLGLGLAGIGYQRRQRLTA
jgi:hypothetical protein